MAILLHPLPPLRSKDGSKLLNKPNEIRDRWKEHYDDLLNRPSNVDPIILDRLEQHPLKEMLDVKPNLEEVAKAVKQMNSGKAPGLDGISAELLKLGGQKMIELLLEVYVSIWDEGALKIGGTFCLFPCSKRVLKIYVITIGELLYSLLLGRCLPGFYSIVWMNLLHHSFYLNPSVVFVLVEVPLI